MNITRKQAKEIATKYLPNWNYEVPGLDNPEQEYFMGMSGGVDSSVLAFVMFIMHPELIGRTKLIFCDTGIEPKECHQILDLIEEMFDTEIIRLQEKTLFDCIEDGNGFLPSAKARYCTATLKIKPFNDYLKAHVLGDDPNKTVINFIGIRYDERDRQGALGLDRVETHFPFVSEMLERETVCKLGSEVGLMSATYYRGRTRSGCEICFFASKAELVALNLWNPAAFRKGAECERLSDAIVDRLTADIGDGLDWGLRTYYPYPNLIKNGKRSFEQVNLLGEIYRADPTGKITWDYAPSVNAKRSSRTKQDDATINLLESAMDDHQLCIAEYGDCNCHFCQGVIALSDDNLNEIEEEETVLYVAVENYMSSTMGMFGNSDPIWSQRLITFSTSTGGLTTALDGYSYHRVMASAFMWESEQAYKESSHITVMAIHFPKGVIPKINYVGDNYTWQQGTSYLQLAHTIRQIERVANITSAYELIKTRTRVAEDGYYIIEKHLRDGSPNYGSIIGLGHYQPKPIEESIDDSYDENLGTARCAICSL